MVIRRQLEHDWRNALWKLVKNPAFEVVAAIAVVLFATWIVVSTEADSKRTLCPVPGAHK